MILTKANLDKIQQSMVFDDSSKTFREAVEVTRRLGIPYLWIDSLCILQDKDDLSDWENEAPKMSDIYNSATVTISAASSVSTSGGLFPKIEDRRNRNEKIVLQITGPNGCSESIHVRSRHRDLFSIKDVVHSSMQPEQPHLRSRGWVLQEDQLAPRMLQFRKEELAWICSTYSRCECRLRPSLPIPHPFRAAPGTIAKTPELTRALDLQWPSIVMEYSRRDLTRISDRIAALSGLANYMEHQTSDTYYCGLWYEDLAFQLLWYVDRNITTEPCAARFQFPYAQSWSWTSVPGIISYYERYPTGSAPSHPAIRTTDAVEPLIRVINVGRLPVDWDKMSGPVLMCPLFLVSRVLPVHFDIVTRQWESLHPVDDFGSANLRVNIDVAEDLPELRPDSSYVFILAGRWVGQGMTIACMQAVCIVARRMPKEMEPYLAAAREFQRRMSGRQNESTNVVSPNITNSYERVGLVRGAGSLKAWERAKVPAEAAFLF
jgi:hypothetical protein